LVKRFHFILPVAVLLGISAFLLYKSSTDAKVETLIAGCGESKIMTMCLIYLLAGAFAVVSKAMGGVDAVVFRINNIDVAYFPLGIFLIAAFIDCNRNISKELLAIGPIAVSLATSSLHYTNCWSAFRRFDVRR
jgi:Na+/H+ antiporter NhaC